MLGEFDENDNHSHLTTNTYSPRLAVEAGWHSIGDGQTRSPEAGEEVAMGPANLLVIAALIATLVVLVLGLSSMARGGRYDLEHSERFMWERVALQALVVILLIAAVMLNL